MPGEKQLATNKTPSKQVAGATGSISYTPGRVNVGETVNIGIYAEKRFASTAILGWTAKQPEDVGDGSSMWLGHVAYGVKQS
jgi:hypothetical protein